MYCTISRRTFEHESHCIQTTPSFEPSRGWTINLKHLFVRRPTSSTTQPICNVLIHQWFSCSHISHDQTSSRMKYKVPFDGAIHARAFPCNVAIFFSSPSRLSGKPPSDNYNGTSYLDSSLVSFMTSKGVVVENPMANFPGKWKHQRSCPRHSLMQNSLPSWWRSKWCSHEKGILSVTDGISEQ
jgi:hypothetical protein